MLSGGKSGDGTPMKRLLINFATRFRRDEGQTMAEYAVVLAVISIGVVGAFTALSGGVSGAINNAVGIF